MIITDAKRKEKGDWDFNMQLSQEEVSYLVELAVTSLMAVGVIKVEEKEGEQEINLDIKQNAPTTETVQ